MSAALQVRRAKPNDVKAMAEFLSHAAGRAVTPFELGKSLLDRGYFLAEVDGRIVGVVGWLVENLVACINDLYVHPATLWPKAGRRLLEAVESEARALVCEAALVSASMALPAEGMAVLKQCGFEARAGETLPRIWQRVAAEYLGPGTTWLVKLVRAEA